MANFLIDHEYTLDITPSARPQLVHVSEYDVGRIFTFTLKHNGQEMTIPSSYGAVTVEGTIGSYAFSEPASIENGKIIFQLTESMTAHAGKAWTKIKFANADAPVSTCAFILAVDRAGVEAGTVIGADGFQGQINDAAEAVLNQIGLADTIQDLFPMQYEEVTIPSTDINNGRYVRADTGATATSEAWSTAYFFPTFGAEKLLIFAPLTESQTQLQIVAAVAFYSAADSASFIEAQTVEQGEYGKSRWMLVDVPQNATQARVTMYTETISDHKILRVYPREDNHDITTSITFAEARKIVKTGIEVKAGQTYRIYPVEYSGSRINFFSNGTGGSRNYVRVKSDTVYVDFQCEVDGILCGYNVEDYIGTINIRVLSGVALLEDNMPRTYYVGANEAYSSLTALLLSLKGDLREKNIVVRSGEYDIFAEYKALETDGLIDPVPVDGDASYNYSTGYMPYNVFIPDNTHIRGEGLVRLVYAPEASETTVNESKTRAPINVAGSMSLENIEIYCKNGRYCIHDDPLQEKEYTGAVKVYKNVKAVKGINDTLNGTMLGFRHCFGCGVPAENSYEFDNCHIETEDTNAATRTLYFHDRKTVGGQTLVEKNSSRITVKNTVCESASDGLAVFFGNIGAALNIRVNIDSCHIGGDIRAADEGDYQTGTKTNSFNISVLRSTVENVVVTDASNPYPPNIYN